MFVRNIVPVRIFGAIRKTILSILIGLMGGGVAVLAQQAPDANATASTPVVAAPVSDAPPPPAATAPAPADPAAAATAVPPAADTTPAPADATPAAPPNAATDAQPDAKPDDLVKAGFVPSTEPVPVKIAADGTAVEDPMDKATAKKVKKLRDKFKGKEKLPKQTPLDIVQGTLTVDGWTGKARMNYDIADLKYLYVWAPGVGTVVISDGWFEQGDIQLHAFSGNTLTVNANGHTIQVTSEKRMLGKKQTSAFVYVDAAYTVPAAFPVMGYGNSEHQPYAWPGAKNVQVAASGVVVPPPLPKDLRPVLAVPGCAPVGSKQALGQTPCTDAVEAARRKALAAAAAAAKQPQTTAAAQPASQTP